MNSSLVNPSVSVDCVVFGFDGRSLKVLLVERSNIAADRTPDHKPDSQSDSRAAAVTADHAAVTRKAADKAAEPDTTGSADSKLPGSMIRQDEEIESAAYRVLAVMTGLSNVYLKQLSVFSDPKRVEGSELRWICDYYGIETDRVVTVAFYSLIKLDERIVSHTRRKGARWVDAHEVKRLAMDHKQILMKALLVLEREVEQIDAVVALLPRRFTIRQLQNLYEAVLGVELDNRNFRKKILQSGYIVPTEEREAGVAHKPALYYRFNSNACHRESKAGKRLRFVC